MADAAWRSQVSFLRLCLERSGKPVIASGDALTKLPRDDGEGSPDEGRIGNKVVVESVQGSLVRHAHFDAGDASHGASNQPGASSASPSSKKFGHVQSWIDRSEETTRPGLVMASELSLE